MSDQPQTPPATQPTSDLQRFREYFAAAMAMVIIAGFVILVVFTINIAINGTDDTFGRAKDLLLFINPIVGMVIGNYFNKVTSDARAEKAEANVQAATDNAQAATQARDKAVDKAQSVENKAEEIRSDLLAMWNAAEKMIEETGGDSVANRGLEPLSAEVVQIPDNKTLWKLQEALKRAEKWK